MRTEITIYLLITFLCICLQPAAAQLKFLVDDFEGFTNGHSDLKTNGVFTFGNITADIESNSIPEAGYAGERSIRLNKNNRATFGGWGKGIGQYIELDPSVDYLNFYIYQSLTNDTNSIKIELQDDDNGDDIFEKDKDDSWIYVQKFDKSEGWKLISIPLNKFRDGNAGGDGIFNLNYKEGKLLTLIITFLGSPHPKTEQTWLFDFICFSKGKLPTGTHIFDPPKASENDFCVLGAWSQKGSLSSLLDIAADFESNFPHSTRKKIGVVHFFQPFAIYNSNEGNQYSSVAKIDAVINANYIPMITLENHFTNQIFKGIQPDLSSIINGHFDAFFVVWARLLKQVKGVVLLRILHEFNGNWYPWCISNNNENPSLLVEAFRHIHDIFHSEKVDNVKFIWCPNSMSIPQKQWNNIMDAYPGDNYVDYVGLDIYNGAGKGVSPWRSFRKEGIENYFTLTQKIPQKPLLICETASREREDYEKKPDQTKATWIMQAAQAITTDMSKIRLLAWFNERDYLMINSSSPAQNAFVNYFMKNDYFKSGSPYLLRASKD